MRWSILIIALLFVFVVADHVNSSMGALLAFWLGYFHKWSEKDVDA